MNIRFRNDISRVLIIAFILFLIPSDSFTSQQNEKKVGLKLIKQAEKLFRNYKYRESIEKFSLAEKFVKLEKNLSRLYLGISKAYYALGLMVKTREVIRRRAMLSVKGAFNKDEFPRGYLKIYREMTSEIEKEKQKNRIERIEEEAKNLDIIEKAEGKTIEIKEAGKKPSTSIIEKSGKKKKKKSSILPIFGGALALGALAFLLTKKKETEDTGSNTASLHIESTPSNATVLVDGANKGVTPCDIVVSGGSRVIKLLIEGWGETTKIQNFSKDTSYTLNVQLSAFIYKSVLSYEINSLVKNRGWDVDHEGNLYAIYLLNNNYHLVKYDTMGVELFDRVLSHTDSISSIFYVFFNNYSSALYLAKIFYGTIHQYDTEGGFSSGPHNNIGNIWYLAETNSGGFYVNKSGKLIQEYSPGMNWVRDFRGPGGEETYGGIKFSSDNQHIFIMNQKEDKAKKYDLSGNLVQSWSVNHARSIASHGTGDLEKIFVTDSNSIEVYNGNGELLSKTSSISTPVWIAGDDSANLYVETGGKIHKFEPSSETYGPGSWTVSSKLRRANSSGFSNGLNNGLRLQKRVDRDAIKKELKDKKEGKKIR